MERIPKALGVRVTVSYQFHPLELALRDLIGIAERHASYTTIDEIALPPARRRELLDDGSFRPISDEAWLKWDWISVEVHNDDRTRGAFVRGRRVLELPAFTDKPEDPR